jgi:catechol 2,3-dioxygenase-like lactoylglutathione lyase family enzyme
MAFKMSSNIAVRTKNYREATEFYTRVLGFPNRSDNPEHANLDASPLTIIIDKDYDMNGPVLELFVDNLEEARDILLTNGCKIIVWKGKGEDCYIQDPFGVIYNLWED